MSSGYLRVYKVLPEFLKKRINPLDYAIRDFVRNAAEIEPPGLVLDAGAGESRFSADFPKHRYLALDSTVGDASWDYSKVDIIGDLAAIPLSDSSIDLAISIQVLEHVRKPEAVLREIHRVLRPGGRLYLTAPQGWHEHQQPNDYYRFTSFVLRDLLAAAGFQNIEIEPMGGYFCYLGHRLTYIPKLLFPGLRKSIRLLLAPVEFLCLGFFCVASPVACYYLDRLDHRREFTLCYRCRAVK